MGLYLSPHRLQISVAYDYASSYTDRTILTPNNFAPAYGINSPYGIGNPYGGPSSLEQWRIFFTQQRCQAFQIQIQEIYDPSFGVKAGAGLTLSGLNLVVGVKKGFTPKLAAESAGFA